MHRFLSQAIFLTAEVVTQIFSLRISAFQAACALVLLTHCRLQIGDTAECSSALRRSAVGQPLGITTSSKDFWDSILVLLAPDGTPVLGSDDDNFCFAAFEWIAETTGTYRMARLCGRRILPRPESPAQLPRRSCSAPSGQRELVCARLPGASPQAVTARAFSPWRCVCLDR